MNEHIELGKMVDTILSSEKIDKLGDGSFISKLVTQCHINNTHLLDNGYPIEIFVRFKPQITEFPATIGNATKQEVLYIDMRQKYLVTTIEDLYALEQELTIYKLFTLFDKAQDSSGNDTKNEQ